MRLWEPCQKCRARAVYERRLEALTGEEIALKCYHCGWEKVVWSASGITSKAHGLQVELPKAGTTLEETFCEVVRSWPGRISTTEVAEHADMPKELAAANLHVLMVKGVIDKVENRVGRKGGSYWSVSRRAADIMGLTRQRQR